jgi:flagellar hook-associated protein 2
MVSQITLGNFYTTTEGKRVLGGVGGSGLDTETLISELTEARRFPATLDQEKITANGAVADAFSEFYALLSTFQSAADALRNPPGVGNEEENAFLFTTGTVTSNTSTAGSTYLSINTSPGAVLQNYTIDEITSIATTATQSTTVFSVATANTSVVTAAPGAQEFKAGTFTVNGQSITLEEGDGLALVAAKFNAVSDNTGINATVIQIASGQYQLSFSATSTGSANDFDLTDPGTVTDATGVLTNIGFNAAVAADDAVFEINGIQVTRSSNSIDDVIDGVTFNLVQTTPALTTLTVAIKPDTTTVQNIIVNFVTAYNELKVFEAKQNERADDGTYAETAILANDITFRTIMTDINTKITSSVAGLATLNNISDIGLSFTTQPATNDTPEVGNILNVDDGALTAALATDYVNVRKLFGFTLTSDNPNLTVFNHTNALGVSEFTLNINPGTNTFQATYDLGAGPVTVNLTATEINGSDGYTLTGPAGGPLEGLVLIYASESADSIDVTVTQGLADLLYNSSDSATAANTGTIAVALKSLEDINTRLEENIARINDQVAQYQQQLIAKFTALEQAISRINTLLQSLDAQQQAAANANN